MVSTLKIWYSGIVILGAVYMCHAAVTEVSDTSCPCNSIPNSACNNITSKCQCNPGYKQDKTNTSICIEVFGATCSNNTDCPSDSHTSCSGSKCLCVQNFANNSGICINTTTNNANAQQNPVAVSSTSCQQIGDCKVAHSECDTSAKHCKCSDGFVASTPGGESCVNAPVSSVTCKQNTDCKVEHSVCDTTARQCTCSEGFKQSTSGTCDKESAAVTARLSTLSIGVSMTLFLFVHKRY